MKWFINQRKTIAQITLLFLISQISFPLLAESVHEEPNRAPRHDYMLQPEDVFGGQPYITYIPKDVHITGDLTVDGELITPGGGSLYVLKAGDTMSGNLVMANQSSVALGEASVNGSDTISIHAPVSVPTSYALTLPSAQGPLYGALINDGSGNLSWQNPRAMVSEVDFDMNGFVNRADSTFTFDDTTDPLNPVFTIQPTGASYTMYFGGREIIKTGPNTLTTPAFDISQSGEHYIYFDPITLNLKEYLSFHGFDVGIYVATVYWSVPESKGYFIGDERHSSKRDTTWHLWAHTTIGTRYESGLAIYNSTGQPISTPTAATDDAIQIGVQSGTIADEDIVIDITHAAIPTQFFQQPINYPAQIPVIYKTGPFGIWKKDSATTFPYKNNDNVAGLIQFNEHLLIGDWTQTAAAATGSYVAYWLCATDNVIEPIVSIQGQREDANLNDARSNNTFQSLDATGLPFQEIRMLYRVIVQTDGGFGGTMHANISDVLDMRSLDLGGLTTYIAPAHSSLVGNDLPDSHPASAIATNAFTHGILIGQTNVQGALDAIDLNINQPLNTTSSPTFVNLTATGTVRTNNLDTTETGPGDVLNIGLTNADVINIGRSGGSINFLGIETHTEVDNLDVTNKIISVNNFSSPGSGFASGLAVLEAGVPTGSILTSNDRNSWQIVAPNTAGTIYLTPGTAGFTLDQGSHDPITLTLGTANGLYLTGPASPLSPNQVLNLQTASAGTTGALTAADWTTFNAKQNQSSILNALSLINSTGFIVATNVIGTPVFASRNLFGTANQVIITPDGTGANANPVFSLPQDIDAAATPTFASMTLNATASQLTLRGSGLTNTVTITAPLASAPHTYTLSDLADSSFVMTEGNQTVNGDKTISGTTNLSTLTGSLPLKLSISKDIISQAINLASTEVTGVLPPANGGTGSSVILTDGQILIGNGTATPSAANISGTPNQITVFNGSGAIILSMPTAVILNAGSSINSASTLTIGDSVTTTLTLGRSGQTTSVASTLNVDSGIIDRTAAGTLAIGGTNVGTLSLGRSGQTTAILGNHTIAGTTNLSSGALTASLPLQLDASKNIISQAINIGTAGITGILPIANGGTNSATTLSNSRIMVSSSGSIVEAPALSNGMVAQTAANTFTARTITGTANQISLINGNGITGDPTISIPSAVILTGASSINSSSSTLAIGDSVTTTLTLGRAGQTTSLPATISMPNLTASLPLQLNASYNVISQAINIGTAGITGTLPIVNGGTNSATALSNNRIMVSSGGAIVEAAALSNGMVAQTAANTFTARTITGASNQVTVTNGDGISGNPTLSLPAAIILSNPSSINSASTLTIGDSATTTLTLGRTGQTTAVASTLNVDSGIIDRTAAGTLAIGGTNVGTLSLGRSGQTTAILGNHTIAGATVASGPITLNATNELRLADSDSSHYVGFKSGATVTSSVVWTLPTADGTSGQVLSTNGSSTLSWQTSSGGGSIAAETYDYLPFPTLCHLSGTNTRTASANFDGSMYTLTRDVTLSKVTVNSSATAAGVMNMYFFQTPNGTAAYSTNLATRVAGLTTRAIASGNNTFTLDSSPVTLKAGNLYVLWGRTSGTFTLRAFNNTPIELFDTVLATGQAPTTFTTNIAATTTPATFDPTIIAGAGTVTPSIVDISPIMRFTNF
jgi:hypothetical protein